MTAATPGQAADWWVCDGPLPAGGRKITGPFATQELALTVRAYVEKAEGRTDLWVDDELAAQEPHAAAGLAAAKQERQPSREVNLLTDDEREPDCLAAHCPPSASVDCEWPKCSPTEQPAPELAAAMDAPAALARVLSWFAEESVVSSRRYASATRAQLAHAHQDGGLTVPEELRRFL